MAGDGTNRLPRQAVGNHRLGASDALFELGARISVPVMSSWHHFDVGRRKLAVGFGLLLV